jgi:3-deoxy-D-manno-octulosonic-acid transferase
MFLNVVYVFAWLVASPWLVWRAFTQRKHRRGWSAKLLGRVSHPLLEGNSRPVAWFHGVSVGEIHLLRAFVTRFRQRRPDWLCVVSTTTETGYDEAAKHFADLPVIFFPFDFTWAVDAAFDRVQPRLVVLSEGEIWPNFLRIAQRRSIKLALVNARMSPRSAKRFLKFRWLVSRLFAAFDFIGAQNAEYAGHYESLGGRNVVVTGNLKYDGASAHPPKAAAMRRLLGLADDALVWVAGSTQEPEESVSLDIYRNAKRLHPSLRLILVPRHPERFDEVAKLLQASGLPFVRRSALDESSAIPPDAILLGDTMGELSALWGLADVAYVGGSLDGKRGGQNMIEPAACGAAVLFGPHTWNFKETVAHLLRHAAAVQVADADALREQVLRLLADAALRHQLGEAASNFVLTQQGATTKTLDALDSLLPANEARQAA